MKTYRQYHYLIEAQGHQFPVSYKERHAAVKLAKDFSVPFEDLLAFLSVPNCAVIMPTAALKALNGFDVNVTPIDHCEEKHSLVRQTRFRSVSAEGLMAQLQAVTPS
jgi:hypothetical protein